MGEKKRGRGRPPKQRAPEEFPKIKRGRGRPPKERPHGQIVVKQKRGRGRPPKERPAAEQPQEQTEEIKRKPGRPPGSPNKVSRMAKEILKEQLLPFVNNLGEQLMLVDDVEKRLKLVATLLGYIMPKEMAATSKSDENRDLGTEQALAELDKQYDEREIAIDKLLAAEREKPEGEASGTEAEREG